MLLGSKRLVLILGLVLVFGLLHFGFTFGQDGTALPSDELGDAPGVDLTVQDITRILTGAACWLISAVFAVMVIALIISGVRYFLATSDQAVAAAKKNFMWTLVGVLVILATNVIIATIANLVATTGGQGTYPYLPFPFSLGC